jgi:hypothetical protein
MKGLLKPLINLGKETLIAACTATILVAKTLVAGFALVRTFSFCMLFI